MPDRPLIIVSLVPLVLTVYLAIAMVPVTVWAQSVPSAGDGRPGGVSLAAAGVAVLPFANVSGDLTDEWIGAGIAYSFPSVQLRLGSESPSTMRAPWAKRPRNTTRMAEPLPKSNRYTRS